MKPGERICRDCGQLHKIGKAHDCKPKAKAAPPPAAITKPAPLPLSPVPVRHITHGPTHGITHSPTHAKGLRYFDTPPKKSALRKAQTYRWRERYPDRWKQYHAAYMRKWRADAKAADTIQPKKEVA